MATDRSSTKSESDRSESDGSESDGSETDTSVPGPLVAPPGDDWVAISEAPLPVEAVSSWVGRSNCGAIVVFSGTTRDHSDGRTGVSELAYEAYEEQVVPRMEAIVAELRSRWSDVARVALLHRIGVVPVGESSVVVAVSSPHRGDAFEAARFGIDTLKSTAPIWKREKWDGGESWGLEAQHITEIDELSGGDQ